MAKSAKDSKEISKAYRWVMIIAMLILGYIGFSYVTQAGQGLNVIQNDGYAGAGGVLIFVSGVIFGLLLEVKGKK